MKDEEILEEKEELYEHYNFTVDKGTELVRIDKYLLNLIPNTSRNKIQQATKAGAILVNGKPEKQNYRVKPLDVISVLMPHPPREIELIPQNIPIQILYEDKDIILIYKEPGMVVHPAYGNYTGTLVNALLYYFQKSSVDVHPLLVHRIDKNTSGILIVAKNELAQNKLANDFFNHTILRKYIALVWGDVKEDEGTIVGNIGRNPKNRLIMTVFPDGNAGKHAVTHYKVIERFGYVTLVECQLETGRTHQIRVHFQYLGHPLFNDASYGGDRILKGTTFTKYKQFINNCFKILPRHALHAKSLGLIHPINNEPLLFNAELPQDLSTLIEKWRHYSKHKEYQEEVITTYDLTNKEKENFDEKE